MLKIGIIGAGNITKRHISTYKENPECEIVSIADINPEQANKTAWKTISKVYRKVGFIQP